MDIETARITKGLASGDPYDQYFAILALEESGRCDLLPRVVPILKSRYSDLRSTAIMAIGRLGEAEAEFYTTVLLPLLRDSNPSVRYDAAQTLGTLAQDRAMPELSRVAIEDSKREVRERAARSARLIIGHALPDDREPELRVVLFDPYHTGIAA